MGIKKTRLGDKAGLQYCGGFSHSVVSHCGFRYHDGIEFKKWDEFLQGVRR